MGLLDKLLGRGKKAAGDVTGDSSMRREGAAQERQGAAEDRASQHERSGRGGRSAPSVRSPLYRLSVLWQTSS